MIFAGERLTNFKIMIGNEFQPQETDAADIGTWSECAHIPGKQLFIICEAAEAETCHKFRQ